MGALFHRYREGAAMSYRVRCPYCVGSEGGRCATSASGRFITECASCGRVVEERATAVEELFVERAQDTPLCIVTPDFSRPPPPPMEDDPFESTGFITAFSTWSLERTPLFAATSSSFCGYLAELERVLLDSPPAPEGGACNNSSSSLVENVRAYMQIMELSSILGLERDISDHAIQLFRDCSSTTYLRNRNIDALATAALLHAIREAQEPRTLQEISAAANIPQKEIGKYIKILGDALKLSQPINSNSISVHMPRFCSLLQLTKTTQDLATHIGEVVINKCFCTRRNPISISAAAIYLACQLEDKRKTQAEICKATGLTEVTLRKVYKELLENWDDLLPKNYTPAVPPEKAFPMTAAALGRLSATKADVNGGALTVANALDSSLAVTSGLPSTIVPPNGNLGVVSGSSSSSALQLSGQVSGSITSEHVTPANFRDSTPPSDGKTGGHMFVLPSVAKEEKVDPEKMLTKDAENSDKHYMQGIENRIEHDPGMNSGGLSFTSQFSSGMPNFRPSFLPFGDPRIFPEINPSIWQPQLLYGVPAFRPAEDKGGRSTNRKHEEPFHSVPKGYSFVFPNLGDTNNLPFMSSPRPDSHQTAANAPHNSSDSDQKKDIQRDRDKGNSNEVSYEMEGNTAGNQVLPQLLRGSLAAPFSNFGSGGSCSSSTISQSFPSNILSFLNPLGSGSARMLPPQVLSNYGPLWQDLSSSTEMHAGPDKGSGSNWGDKLSHGTAPASAVGEALNRLASTHIGTSMSMVHPKGSQPNASQSSQVWLHPSLQLSFPAVNGGSHAHGSSIDGSATFIRDTEGNVISNTGNPRLKGEGTNLNWPSSDGQSSNAGINIKFGADHTAG